MRKTFRILTIPCATCLAAGLTLATPILGHGKGAHRLQALAATSGGAGGIDSPEGDDQIVDGPEGGDQHGSSPEGGDQHTDDSTPRGGGCIDDVEHTPGSPVIQNRTEPTCEKDGGYDTVVSCEACGSELSREHTVLKATGHTPGRTTRKEERSATCTRTGRYVLVTTCRVCGAEMDRTVHTTSKRSHTPGNPTRENIQEATCAHGGSFDLVVSCTTCGHELRRAHVNTPATEHVPTSEQPYYVTPTCDKPGAWVTPATVCAQCGATIAPEQSTPVPALGHAMGYAPAVAPDAAGNNGHEAYYFCRRCGQMFYDRNGVQSVASYASLVIPARGIGTTGGDASATTGTTPSPVSTQGASSVRANDGTIATNYGAIATNAGILEQNFGAVSTNTGTIEANYGTIARNEGTVNHQFFNMTTTMDPGTYSVTYDGSFQARQTNDGLQLFLEAGQSAVITLSAHNGKRIAQVTYVLNGEELELEDLGDDQFRITAPDAPTTPDGFAINEGNLHVTLDDDPNVATDDSWKSKALKTHEQREGSADILRIIDLDRSRNKGNPAIRVEGMDLDAAGKDLRRALSERTDIKNALASTTMGGTGTMVFMLDNGARIVCDVARARALVNETLPKIIYTSDKSEDDEATQEEPTITLVFKPETTIEDEREKFNQTNTYQPEIIQFNEPKEPDDDEDDNKACLTPDTLITLADGSRKRVDALTSDDRLLVWDFDRGRLADAPLTFYHVVKEEASVLRVSFDDGTSVGIVGEHAFFDLTDRRFVAIRDASQEQALLGHRFAKLVSGRIAEVTLTGIRADGTTRSYYSPVTEAHFNCFANDLLNVSGFMHGLYNVFDLADDELKFDAVKKAADIEAAGVMPYEAFAGVVSRELYDRNQAGWLGVSVAKGLTTTRELCELFEFCLPFFVEPSR